MFLFQSYIIRKIILLICDVAILLSIPISSIYIYFFIIFGVDFKVGSFIMDKHVYIANMVIYLIFFYIMDLYNEKRKYSDSKEIITIILTIILASFISIVFLYFVGMPPMGRGIFLIYISLLFICIAGHRYIYYRIFFSVAPAAKALLIVDHQNSASIASQFNEVSDSEIQIIETIHICDEPSNLKYNITVENLKPHLAEIQVLQPDLIITDVHDSLQVKMTGELIWCKKHGIQITNLSEAFEKALYRIPLNQYAKYIDIITQQTKAKKHYFRTKGLVECFIAIALLVLLTPLSFLTAIAIKLESRGPVFYRQKRVGQNGRHYYLMKFRSMIQDAEKETGPVWASENDPRVTRVGRVIRALRIDELPQLINVIRGEMGLVGPRPERPEFVSDFLGGSSKDKWTIPLYSERLTVKPGITGWAQIMYLYAQSREQSITKLEYDLYYIKNISFLLDLTIMLRTVRFALFGWISR